MAQVPPSKQIRISERAYTVIDHIASAAGKSNNDVASDAAFLMQEVLRRMSEGYVLVYRKPAEGGKPLEEVEVTILGYKGISF